MKLMWMMLFLILPVVALAYVGWHVYTLLPLPAVWRWTVVGAGVASFLLMFANLSRIIDSMPMRLARGVYDVGTSSLFILLYLVMIFLVLDIGRLVRLIPKEWLHSNFYTSVALIIGVFVLFLYGNINYRHKVRHELTVTTEKHLDRPLKLVMMSDLHLGYHNPRRELARWVDMVNAEQPDVVLIAGDIIDMSIRPLMEEDMAAEFRRIKAPVYACLGNHEYYTGEPLAQQFYNDAGIHLLQDTAAVVGDLVIIGRDDRTNRHRKALGKIIRETKSGNSQNKPVTAEKYSIVLDHQPYHLEQAELLGVDFQLSGHTHYGQVWPISWIEDAMYECAFGSHQRGRTQYYVSSGIGIWGGKFRIGTRSEYVVMNLVEK